MKSRSFLVGVFVIAALALFTAGLFLIGNRHEMFAQHMEYYVEFANLAGLTKGAKVQVAGMDAGQVMAIGVPDSPAARFKLQVRINDALRGLVRTDSVAAIATEGVVGDTFLLIRPGSSSAPAAGRNATLTSKEPLDISELLDQGKGVMTDVDATVRQANGLLTSVGGNLNSTLSGVQATVANVNDVVLGLKAGRGPAGMILRDEAVAGQIRQAVTNAQEATGNLNHASAQADTMVADLGSRQLPQKIDDVLGSVKSAASNLDVSSRQLRDTVAEATAPDAQGVTAGVNIRESLSNVNTAAGNVTDETEALKHNFLLRGFFRRRGYYNLANIPPDKYRADKLIKSPSAARSWLAADALFTEKPDGSEQLTVQGKSLLDSAIAKHGDPVLDSPVVIEGYSNDASGAAQLVRARRRAILVRSYLEDHLQLNASNIGVVGLSDQPPNGLDRTSWNGICIVVLTQKH